LDLTPHLAVEKVLYRLALRHAGAVPIARVFLELPFSLEEIEDHADKVADGRSVVRNDYGEFLTYEFPELSRQMPSVPDDCPICFGEIGEGITVGGEDVRQPLVCDGCYANLRKQHKTEPDPSMMGKLAHFFTGEEEQEDLTAVAAIEHEIFFIGLRAQLDPFTHTTIAAQSRRPADQIKERLDRMAARRYIKLGLLPSGDAVAYTFPAELDYPKHHYERLDGKRATGRLRPATGRVEDGIQRGITAEPVGDEPPSEPPKPLPKVTAKPKKAPLKITIKSRRDRPTS